jgi:ribulose 1,5-bisphosphate synthetase/thiazole synthase
VIVIGAGYSGIYCGIRIPEKLRNVELVIYEKNAGVGGTWYENRWVGPAAWDRTCVNNDGNGLTRLLTDIWDALAMCLVSTYLSNYSALQAAD